MTTVTGQRLEVYRTEAVDWLPMPPTVETSSDEVATSIVKMMPHDGKEHLVAIATDAHGKPLAWQVVSSGTVDSVMLYPRDVFSFALTVPRVRFVGIAHNHPSGDVTPSQADKAGTANMAKAGAMLGIDLLWSLVVTHESADWSLIVPDGASYTGKPGDEDAQPQGQKPAEINGDPEGDPDDAEPAPEAAPTTPKGRSVPTEDVSIDELRKLLKKATGAK